MWTGSGMLAGLTLTAIFVSHTAGLSAPGKPRLTGCRSPEKETFTCWWEPGDDGGLETSYALYYHLDSSETVYECPDYRTAGENSCFFSKNDTSMWVTYNISVVATNAMGRSVSQPLEVDVVYIVQPNSPEDVRLLVVEGDADPYLRVSWEKPLTADTQSGWITLIYQLRVKLGNQDTWEEYDAGMQKSYNIFSLHSGMEYVVQVRCKPGHGFWSEWSSPVCVQIPNYLPRERTIWIMLAVFAGFILLILTWTVNIKRNSVKHCLLPPVPGPKIKGFDQQLLKSGKSEEMFHALVIQDFPHTSCYDDLLVDYLEVYDVEKQEPVQDRKDVCEDALYSQRTLDNDSGRGSCDSHTLLTERSTEGGAEGGVDPQLGQCVASLPLREGKVEAWSAVFSPSHSHHHGHHHHFQQKQPGGAKPVYHNVMEIPGDSTSAPGCCGKQVPDVGEPQAWQYSYTQGADSPEGETELPIWPLPHPAEYVEVQTVNQQNILLLRPLADPRGHDLELSDYGGEDYSKVREVTSDNMVLLQREPSVQQGVRDSGLQDACPTLLQDPLQDPLQPCKHTCPLQEGMQLVANGYVDSTVMLC